MRFRYTFQSSFSQLVAFMHLIQVCHLAVFKTQLFQSLLLIERRRQNAICYSTFYIFFYYLLYYEDLYILGYKCDIDLAWINSCIMQIIFWKLHSLHCYTHFKIQFDFVDVTSFSSYHVSRYWTSSNSRFYQT